MQVSLIDRLNDLQLGLNSLQNPSPPSPITTSLSVSGIQSISIAYNFCKWGAVILALVATFGSIINRVTVFFIRFRNKAASSLPSLDDFEVSDSDDDDDDYSLSNDDDDATSSSEFEEDDEENEPSASGFYFRFDGSDDEFQSESGLQRRRRRSFGDMFSFSEIANSKSVVKLWDSIGFGLGLDFDFDDYEEMVTPRGNAPVISTAFSIQICY